MITYPCRFPQNATPNNLPTEERREGFRASVTVANLQQCVQDNPGTNINHVLAASIRAEAVGDGRAIDKVKWSSLVSRCFCGFCNRQNRDLKLEDMASTNNSMASPPRTGTSATGVQYQHNTPVPPTVEVTEQYEEVMKAASAMSGAQQFYTDPKT